MRAILAWIGIFGLATITQTCGTHLRFTDVRANEAEAIEQLGGFSGYGFGSGDRFILDDMEASGYTPIEITSDSVWYDGELLSYPMEFGYIFRDGFLIGGAWLIADTSDKAFLDVANFLREIYGGRIEVTVDGSLTVQAHQGPDALILHSLNRDTDEHEVSYMRID